MISVASGFTAPSELCWPFVPASTIGYGRDDPPAPAHSVLPIVEAD
jgi:hypothetical protein